MKVGMEGQLHVTNLHNSLSINYHVVYRGEGPFRNSIGESVSHEKVYSFQYPMRVAAECKICKRWCFGSDTSFATTNFRWMGRIPYHVVYCFKL